MNRILTIINIECHEFPQPICDVSVIPIPTFVDIQQLKKKKQLIIVSIVRFDIRIIVHFFE